MKAERAVPEKATPSPVDLADESQSAKVRRLHPVKAPYAWDPYEVWRTRVKPKGAELSPGSAE